MKFQLFLLISSLIALSQQYGQKPHSESQYQPEPDNSWKPEPENNWRPEPANNWGSEPANNWGSKPDNAWKPEPDNAWNPQLDNNWKPELDTNWKPEPDNDWSLEPVNDWSSEPVPRPERPCKCLPKATTVEFTPFVEVVVTHNTQITCDAKSKVKKIIDQSVGPLNITCNGVAVITKDQIYDIVISSGHNGHDGYGGKNTEQIILKNYTLIRSFNDGNIISQECGVISNGKCAGDIFSGTANRQANDQKGCCKGGITGETALARQFTIKGKCASNCAEGTSVWTFAEPVSNYGSVDRTIAADTHE